MAFEAYMSVNGTKQGQFKGEGNPRTKGGWAPLVAFSFSGESPHDVATGLASGKIRHQPFTFTKEVGTTSPQLFQSSVTNEVMRPGKLKHPSFTFTKEVGASSAQLFQAYATGEVLTSVEIQYTSQPAVPGSVLRDRIKLSNARILEIKPRTAAGPGGVKRLEDITLDYEEAIASDSRLNSAQIRGVRKFGTL